MRLETLFFTGIVASILPVFAEAQHSHGGMSGMDQPQRQERKQEPAPKPTPGLLPVGSTRGIEVLVLSYGFSPAEIRADVGETVTLLVRREDPVCANGLEIPDRAIEAALPLGKTVPLTLELKRAERIALRCKDESIAAFLVVRSP
jgi:hypothetical protein